LGQLSGGDAGTCLCDPAELEGLNDVDPRNLQIGESLLIPEPESDELIVY